MNQDNAPDPTRPDDEDSNRDGKTGAEFTRLGHFVIREQIGRGGMGVVYRAFDKQLNRDVALKVLPRHARDSRVSVMRFQIEARATARLNHENIVPVYEVAEDKGVPYYAMKLISGTNLSSVLNTTRDLMNSSKDAAQDSTIPMIGKGRGDSETAKDFSGRAFHQSHQEASSKSSVSLIRSVAFLGSQVARALDHAHEHAIVHRDIKPSNLLIDKDDKVWLSDFGLAQMRDAPSITRSRDLLGTYRYMSPEQALGGRSYVDHRTDIYSLGATLYELATLQPMCAGKSEIEILQQLHFGRPIPIRKINPGLSKDFETVISRATERSPDDRYHSAADFADDLLRVAEGHEITTKKVSPLKRGSDWLLRRPKLSFGVLSGVVGFIFLLLGATFLLAVQQSRTHEALTRMTAQRMIAEMALKLFIDPGGAIALGLKTPGIEHDAKGLNILMQAVDNCHEIKTVYLDQRFPGQLAWNPNLDSLLVCTDPRQFGGKERAQFIDTETFELSETLESENTVTSAAFSKQGNLLLTTGSSFGVTDTYVDSEFSTPTLWNAKTRKLEKRFPDARLANCTTESFSSDGRWLALPLRSQGAKVYSLVDDAESISLSPQDANDGSAVMGAVFSKDQRFVAIWASDGHIAVFDPRSGTSLKEFPIKRRSEHSLKVSFSSDSNWLLASSDSGTWLFQTADWNAPHILETGQRGCFIGPNHDVALISGGVARLFNPDFELVTKEVELPFQSGSPSPIGNSSAVVADSRGSACVVVDFSDATIAAKLNGHSDRIIDVICPEYSDLIASVSWDGTCRFWDRQSDRDRREQSEQLIRYPTPTIGYSPDAKKAVLGLFDQEITRCFRKGGTDAFSDLEGSIELVLGNGHILATSNFSVLHYDAQSLALQSRVSIGDGIEAIEQVGKLGVVITTYNGDVFHWDLESPVATKLNSSGSSMRVSAIPTTSQIIATSGEDLLLIDMADFSRVTISNELTTRAIDVEVSPDRTEVAVLSTDRLLSVWDIESKERRDSLEFPSNVADVRFVQGGKALLVYEGGLGSKVFYLESENLRVEREIGFPQGISDLSIAKDGNSCSVATKNGVYLWDFELAEAQLFQAGDCVWSQRNGDDLWFSERLSSGSDEALSGMRSVIRRASVTSSEVVEEFRLPFDATALHPSIENDDIFAAGKSVGFRVVDAETMVQDYAVWGQDPKTVLCEFDATGDRVITVSESGGVVSNGRGIDDAIRLGQHREFVTAAALSPDRTVVLVSDASGRLTEWKTGEPQNAIEYEANSIARQIHFGKKNNRFLTVHEDDRVLVWERTGTQGKLLDEFKFEHRIRKAYLSPDAASFVCIFGQDNWYPSPSRYYTVSMKKDEVETAVLIDLVSRQPRNLPSELGIADAVFCNGGQQLAVLGYEGTVNLFDLQDGNELESRSVSSGAAQRLLRVDSDSPTFFCFVNGSVVGWNAKTGEQEFELSEVVTPLRIHSEYDRWKLNHGDGAALTFLRDLHAISYPRSPLNHAKQMAPRGLTARERSDLFLEN
ncbi:MAG: protein kinase domain-containing protein [Aureliella sp.]